jgi:sugar/nucleoside kinase (ribokinase family)
MKYDILVYGPLFCDLIFTDLPAMPALGREIFAGGFTIAIGGSAIVAAALHRLGAQVGLIAELGSDPLSQIARTLLDDLGLDRRLIREHDRPLPQVTVALSLPADRAFITRFERPAAPPDLAAILRDNPARHLHVSSFLAVQETPEAASIARAAGMTVSMDPGWDETALRDPRVRAMIRDLDIFLPSRAELCWIAGTDDVESALTSVSRAMTSGLVVMKDGRNGAIAVGSDVRQRVGALPVVPVDTTGAGDAFDAGFLYAFVRGQPLTTCLQYGSVCGALATTAVGGATAVPTLKEVDAWLSKLPS